MCCQEGRKQRPIHLRNSSFWPQASPSSGLSRRYPKPSAGTHSRQIFAREVHPIYAVDCVHVLGGQAIYLSPTPHDAELGVTYGCSPAAEDNGAFYRAPVTPPPAFSSTILICLDQQARLYLTSPSILQQTRRSRRKNRTGNQRHQSDLTPQSFNGHKTILRCVAEGDSYSANLVNSNPISGWKQPGHNPQA